ncbi:hypothetical protein CLAFUW4_14815 [Fulvia fulva]|nr:hypothetical protein CLAFUR0_14808 [Fulvia fulva]WPV23013.1 hypothetical protein CLAFUW4_14815 [Fulvia fulva]WPV37966.1 hypothetical protein CLAFUW7_14816 [Fulvia fulva]
MFGVLVWGCKTLEQRFIIYHSGLNRLSPFLRSGQKTPTPCFVVQHLYSLSSPDHCPYDNLFATGETVDYYKNDACKLYKAHNYEDWRIVAARFRKVVDSDSGQIIS